MIEVFYLLLTIHVAYGVTVTQAGPFRDEVQCEVAYRAWAAKQSGQHSHACVRGVAPEPQKNG